MAAYISFQPSDFFSTTLYTGTGSSNAITGLGFQPDFVWVKNRDATDNHLITDSVRGTDSQLYPSSDSTQGTLSNVLTAFGADGFTMDSGNNSNTVDYASWSFKAGTTTGIAGSPSITPASYSFNTTSKFSIIKYTGNSTSGATIPHGLGVVPQMIIIKSITQGVNWAV